MAVRRYSVATRDANGVVINVLGGLDNLQAVRLVRSLRKINPDRVTWLHFDNIKTVG